MSPFVGMQGLLTYDDYMRSFENWVLNHESSMPNASQAYIEFTRLNWMRTKRIQKTLALHAEVQHAVMRIKNPQIWYVITEGWCGDSAQTLPVIAAAAALNPEKIKLFIALRDEHPGLIDQYLTNGAKAIPKWIATDAASGRELFVWGPRPAPAQALLIEHKKDARGKSWDDFEKELHGWYAKDQTNTTQHEIAVLLAPFEV